MVNFPPRQIGPFLGEVLTLGMPDADGAVVLVAPDFKVPMRRQIDSDTALNYLTITWRTNSIRDAKALAERLAEVWARGAASLAISRGGLVPATIIARALNIRRSSETVSVVAYDQLSQGEEEELLGGEPKVTKLPLPEFAGDGEGFP